jgi:MFS family permease
MSVLTLDRVTVTRARTSVFVVFAAAGFSFSSWASRLPDIKRILDLTPGQLGTLLLAAAVGSVLGLPLSGRVIQAIGTRRTVLFGALASTLGIALAAVGVDVLHSYLLTWPALFLCGLGMGTWDVAMNHEGAEVERGLGRAIMPWFHASFSAATVVSALVGSGLTALGVPVWVHLCLSSVLVATAVVLGVRRFLPIEDAPEASAGASSGSAWLEPRTLLIGVVVLAAAFTEGSANDWVAVAMVEGHSLPAWLGVMGFAVFLGFMTIGRIAGTSALDKFGRVPVLRALFGFAMVGSLFVVFGSPILAFVGAALWGIGASLGFPVGMSAAADDPARAASRLSVVSTVGYLAFLGGPPLLGYLGDHTGVLKALLAVAAFSVPALLAVPAVREPAKS